MMVQVLWGVSGSVMRW